VNVAIGETSAGEYESCIGEDLSENAHKRNGAAEPCEKRVLAEDLVVELEERKAEFFWKLWSDES